MAPASTWKNAATTLGTAWGGVLQLALFVVSRSLPTPLGMNLGAVLPPSSGTAGVLDWSSLPS